LKYDFGICLKLVEHMSEGLSYESFAGAIGVHRSTLYRWEKAHPEFLEAKEIATAKSLLWWEKVGQQGLWNENFGQGQGSKTLNATIWIFNMKNRFGWRDRQPDEERKPLELPQPIQVTDDQLKTLIEKARAKK
jgi:transcriptional regulator with XRE-family HTH domain